MTATPGVFVVLEGGEGAGKSTLVAALADAVLATGRTALVTREPGATALGSRLRTLLLDPAVGAVDPRAEALLYAADRTDHVARVVRPALAAGHVVLCDRYLESSIAYQGAARGLGEQDVARLSDWGTDGLRPDLTILLDVAPELGRARAADRSGGTLDRLEAEPGSFHARVRRSYLDQAAADPARHLVLDASRPAAAVLRDALLDLDGLLAATGLLAPGGPLARPGPLASPGGGHPVGD